MLAIHGYLFPIDDHNLTVKNDGTFYRLQTPYFWPSNCWEPENTDYGLNWRRQGKYTKRHYFSCVPLQAHDADESAFGAGGL